MHTFKSGGTSTEIKPLYDAVPKELIQYAAARFGYGRSRGHKKDSWKFIKDDEEYRADRKNHTFEHFLNWMETGDKEQLQAVICNLSMFAWLAEQPVEEPVVDHPKDVDDLIFDQVAQEPAPVVEAEVIKPRVDVTISLADTVEAKIGTPIPYQKPAPCTTCSKTPGILGSFDAEAYRAAQVAGMQNVNVQPSIPDESKEEPEPLSLGKQLLSNFLSNFRHD